MAEEKYDGISIVKLLPSTGTCPSCGTDGLISLPQEHSEVPLLFKRNKTNDLRPHKCPKKSPGESKWLYRIRYASPGGEIRRSQNFKTEKGLLEWWGTASREYDGTFLAIEATPVGWEDFATEKDLYQLLIDNGWVEDGNPRYAKGRAKLYLDRRSYGTLFLEVPRPEAKE